MITLNDLQTLIEESIGRYQTINRTPTRAGTNSMSYEIPIKGDEPEKNYGGFTLILQYPKNELNQDMPDRFEDADKMFKEEISNLTPSIRLTYSRSGSGEKVGSMLLDDKAVNISLKLDLINNTVSLSEIDNPRFKTYFPTDTIHQKDISIGLENFVDGAYNLNRIIKKNV